MLPRDSLGSVGGARRPESRGCTVRCCMNILNDKVVKHSLACLSVQKRFVEDVSFYVKIWPKLTHRFKNADFRSIFALSTSAVTPSEKKSN